MGTFSIWHWLVVLVLAILIFGTKKLRGLGSDLGGAIKGFKESMRETDETGASPKELPKPGAATTDAAATRDTNIDTRA